MRIRYSEAFFSMQGEAEGTGEPAVWLRFFGCNLNCSGFGQKNPTDPETYVLPYKDFDIKDIARVEDLPVWKTGCDSSYSWAIKFKHLAHDATAEEVCDRLTDLMRSPSNPEGLFVHPVTRQHIMLSFTGGEPMLNQPAMMAIVTEFSRRGNQPRKINIETNVTKDIKQQFNNFMMTPMDHGIQWHWSMSPKLFSVSGEKDVINPETIVSYYIGNWTSGVLKFVVNGTPECWAELENALDGIRAEFKKAELDVPPVYVMPVGATQEDQSQPEIGEMCIEALKRGYFVAPRVQCYIWGNLVGF